jgi:hypothetical protein
MDNIWVLSYADPALECWYFSTEEKAVKAKEALISFGKFHHLFNIVKHPFDTGPWVMRQLKASSVE